MNCSKCGFTMNGDVPSLLEPTYKTWMCFNCGGLFYELIDPAQLEAIQQKVLENMTPKLRKAAKELVDRQVRELENE